LGREGNNRGRGLRFNFSLSISDKDRRRMRLLSIGWVEDEVWDRMCMLAGILGEH